MAGQTRTASEQRAALAGDPQRPRYHFLPPANWMNDPNGPIQWQGRYHLFYQHNPLAPHWGHIHWGHAASDDLLHWEDLPIALAPSEGWPDEGGCWSGCAVDNEGVPTLVYTGVSGRGFAVQRTCLATSADGLLTWQKHPAGVVTAPPPGMDLVGFRDPCVWREDDTWYQAIGTGTPEGGAVLLYRSEDLVHWRYLHPLYARSAAEVEPLPTGYMWECPQFFPLGDRHVLILSAMVEGRPGYVVYWVGRYKEHRFTPESLARLDYGAEYYAPIVQIDERGRRILWGWSKEGRSAEAQEAAGWAGVMALPRLLTLRPDGTLGVEPVPEVEALRRAEPSCSKGLSPSCCSPVPGGAAEAATTRGERPCSEGFSPSCCSGDCLEILAELEVGEAAQVGLGLRCSPGGEEETLIYYDRASSSLVLDRTRASLDPATHRDPASGPLALAPGEPLCLRIFIDRSLVEVYANGRACLTARIYPTRPDSLGVKLLACGGEVGVRALHAWEIGPIWG